MSDPLDAHDRAFHDEAFLLAEAVRRFLARRSTRQAWDAGLLDDDVVRPLVESADRMWLIRTQRVGAARSGEREVEE